MKVKVLSQFAFGSTTVIYLLEDTSGSAGIWLVPTDELPNIKRLPQTVLRGEAEYDMPVEQGQPLWSVDPLVHLQRAGEEYPAFFSQGRTLRNGPCTRAMRYVAQRVEQDGALHTVITELRASDGTACEHRLCWIEGAFGLAVSNRYSNGSDLPVTLEMLTSFSLGGITPFAADDAPGRLLVHRIRSSWAAEGRLNTDHAERLQLEPSCSRYSAACERFGQVGTMPVRQWFPFVAVEDTQAGVLWGAQLAWSGSWQMELYRKDNQLCISGGLADRELGHWTKTIAPGESFATPPAYLACVRGNLDDLCQALTSFQAAAVNTQPKVEQDLPIVFNEWCTTWGNPNHDKLLALAKRLHGTDVKYLVVDAGWYEGHGDWEVNAGRFPHGLKATADAIRDLGLIPGLWFEMENCIKGSKAYARTDWHLKRDGHPISLYQRRFWDMRQPEVIEYLALRVIGLLRDNGIGYLKVDYNETLGIGCDGAESLGEGLRQQVEASYGFFQRIRRELPELVIENCASGGHRLEPSMLGVTAMSSFSDAHESPEIPIIAANLHRVMLPRQSQIWAVLRNGDDQRRLVYSLAATFLGRMCLSGDIADLRPEQWQVCLDAQRLYRKVWPIIRDGKSRRYGPEVLSYRHAQGWQAIIRERADGREALAVVHTFGQSPTDIAIPLPGRKWKIAESFLASGSRVSVRDEMLYLHMDQWNGVVLWLTGE